MKNTKHYTRAILSLLMVLLISFSGCKKNEPTASSQEPQAVSLETAAPEPQPVVGGELALPMPRNPFRTETESGNIIASVNPLVVNTEEMRNLYLLVYDPLVRCDSTNKLVPSLAETWTCDDTGRTWTFTLRENVLWHDGSGILTSDDVIYTVAQIKALGASSYYGAIVNKLENIEKVDERTFRVTMKSAGSAALYSLSIPIVQNGDDFLELNGTGPYRVKSTADTRVELSINAQWWRQGPYIETVRFLARESNDVALDSYEAGQLNFVPTSNVSAGKYRETGLTNVLDVMTQDCEVLLINHRNSLLRNLDVRKAIAFAVDRKTIVSNVYMNRAEVCDVPVPPDSFLYDSTSKVYDYNLTTAAELMEAAGWVEKDEDGILIKDGRQLTLRLLVNESTESTYRQDSAALVASQLKKLGVLVEVETAKLSINEPESEFEKRLREGDFDLAMVGFNLDRSGSLEDYLLSSGSRSYGGYTSENLTELMRAASNAVEEKDMRETHAALQQAFVRELPFIVLGFRKNSVVYSAQIKNVEENARGSDIMRRVYSWYIKTSE